MVRGLGLPRDRLLEWTAADGWEPLCEFLGKDVPTEAFPQGNPTTEWVERVGATMQEHNRRAVRNMLVFFAMLIACVSWVGYVVGLGV
jgi:type IV secretory pathway TrbF-like protein